MRQLGSRYTLEQVIGRGATGEVWRANDAAGEAVAVKVLRSDLVNDPDVVARFVRERNLVRSVHSPHVVTVRDLVVEGSTLAIVMEYVPRADLRSFLRDNGGVLAPAQAVAVTRQIFEALDAVHAAGIVHRDVKPENVLVDVGTDGLPIAKLSDFGVSRLLDGATLTRVTGLVGTPRYMAPELATGDDPSPSSDLYAAGIVLYELLTGRVPFTGDHPIAMLRAHTQEPPPRPRRIDPQLWKVLAKLLEKKPGARYADAAAAVRALDAVAPRLDGARPLTDPRGNVTIHASVPGHSDRQSPISLSSLRRFTSLPRRHGSVRWQHPRLMVGGASFAVIALVAALFAVSGGGSSDTGERAWVDTYKASGYAVWRDWQLTGAHGDTFQATETVMPISHTLDAGASYTLVVPKSLAKHARDVRGVAGTVVKADPVISVPLGALTTSSARTITYTIHVADEGRKSSRLDAWSREMLRARRAFAHEAPALRVSGEVPKTTKTTPDSSIGAQHAAAVTVFTGHAPPASATTTRIVVVRDPGENGPPGSVSPTPGPNPGPTRTGTQPPIGPTTTHKDPGPTQSLALASITVNPAPITLAVGGAPEIASFTGTMSDLSAAPGTALAGVTCFTDDPSIATCQIGPVDPAAWNGTVTVTASGSAGTTQMHLSDPSGPATAVAVTVQPPAQDVEVGATLDGATLTPSTPINFSTNITPSFSLVSTVCFDFTFGPDLLDAPIDSITISNVGTIDATANDSSGRLCPDASVDLSPFAGGQVSGTLTMAPAADGSLGSVTIASMEITVTGTAATG